MRQVRYFPFITAFLCFNYGISIWLPGSGLRTVRFLTFHSSIALLRNYFSMRTFTHSLVGHYPIKPRLLHTHSNSVFPTTPLTNPPLSLPTFITLLVSGQLEFRWNPAGRASSWRPGRWSSGEKYQSDNRESLCVVVSVGIIWVVASEMDWGVDHNKVTYSVASLTLSSSPSRFLSSPQTITLKMVPKTC